MQSCGGRSVSSFPRFQIAASSSSSYLSLSGKLRESCRIELCTANSKDLRDSGGDGNATNGAEDESTRCNKAAVITQIQYVGLFSSPIPSFDRRRRRGGDFACRRLAARSSSSFLPIRALLLRVGAPRGRRRLRLTYPLCWGPTRQSGRVCRSLLLPRGPPIATAASRSARSEFPHPDGIRNNGNGGGGTNGANLNANQKTSHGTKGERGAEEEGAIDGRCGEPENCLLRFTRLGLLPTDGGRRLAGQRHTTRISMAPKH